MNRFLACLCALLLPVSATVCRAGDPANPDKDNAAKQEMEKLQGTWRLVSEVIAGEKSDMTMCRVEWVFKGDHVTITIDGEKEFAIRTRYRLLPSTRPKGFDLMERDDKHVASRAIYSLEGDTLTMAHFRMSEDRPKDFRPSRGTGGRRENGKEKIIRVFRREKSR